MPPVLIAAGIGAGASVFGALKTSSAANKATQAETAANDKAMALQQQQYDDTKAAQAPWQQTGLAALQQLGGIHGFSIPGVGVANDPNAPVRPQYGMSVDNYDPQRAYGNDLDTGVGTITNPGAYNFQPGDFQASPDYQFRMDQSQRAVTANAAARGLLDSGSLGSGLINTAGNLASQEYGNFYNRQQTNYNNQYNANTDRYNTAFNAMGTQYNNAYNAQNSAYGDWYNRLAAAAGLGQTANTAITQAGQQNVNGQTNGLLNTSAAVGQNAVSQANTATGLVGNLAGIGTGLIQNYAQPAQPTGGYSGAGLTDSFSRLAARPTVSAPVFSQVGAF